ncbi:DUF3073 domain-containing protein [Gordonia jinhuaensis]|uniref:DUF3073 domain-containing protein n=1 Tax=Gordonia jinhuaensis TaxID=1517702 RepID=A0A916T5D0_9ACTN|nr:DUF3073 domain-containing protein [Gordonia jinhuaensis]GGB32403.1 hypothetical protein GCM10011489_20750 [Gordonia jinhuaensis]
MGRGRAKAKQTKVARQLKYSSQHMDLESLQRELSNDSHDGLGSHDRIDDDPVDRWAEEDEWRRA